MDLKLKAIYFAVLMMTASLAGCVSQDDYDTAIEEHEDESMVGCPACFKNLMMEKYDHKLIRKFLEENGVNPQNYLEGVYTE